MALSACRLLLLLSVLMGLLGLSAPPPSALMGEL